MAWGEAELSAEYDLTSEEFDALRGTMLQLSVLTCLTANVHGSVGLTSEEMHAVFENAWLPLKDVVEQVTARDAAMRKVA